MFRCDRRFLIFQANLVLYISRVGNSLQAMFSGIEKGFLNSQTILIYFSVEISAEISPSPVAP